MRTRAVVLRAAGEPLSEDGALTWSAAQAGVADRVADAVSEGIVSEADADRFPFIAAVWVNPADGAVG